MPTTSTDADLPLPKRGELYRVMPDGRWAFWFDHHIISNFSECEQKFVYNTLKRFRLKGHDRACISVGQWWSRVSEIFYEKMAVGNVTIEQMAQIALECWIENNMDAMSMGNPKAYEKFAMPTDASLFASLLGLKGFDHAMMIQYKKRAVKLREEAEVLAKTAAAAVSQEDMAAVTSAVEKLMAAADLLEKRTILPLGPIVMAVQYYNAYAEQDARDWQIVGAEKPFGGKSEVLVGENDKVQIYYMGKPDLVIYEKPTDLLMPMDQKTKDYVPDNSEVLWKPHSQTAGYIYACQKIADELGMGKQVDRCIISIAARNNPAPPKKQGDKIKPRFRRVRPHYSVQEIQEWQATIMNKGTRLREALESGKYTRQDGFLCHVFSGCDYRRLCAVPEGSRDLVAKSDYVQLEAWSPYEKDDEL